MGGYYGVYPYYYGYDGIFALIVIGVFVLSLAASIAVSINFKKYSKVGTHRGITGADAAKDMCRSSSEIIYSRR